MGTFDSRILRWYSPRLGFFCAYILLALIPAFAYAGSNSADDRVGELERMLNQSLKAVEQLSGEVQSLKEEVQASGAGAVEDEVEEQSARIDELEDMLLDVDEKVGSRAVINAFEAESLDFGGFLHSTFTYVDGEDGSATAFNRNIFEILIKANLDEYWSAFIAQAFIRQSEINFDDIGDRRDPSFAFTSVSPQVIAWANYRHNDALNVRFGRFITPQGIINIEHFPAVLLDPEQPQFLRPFGGQTIFPNFVDGLQLHGTKFLASNNQLQYAAYTSNFVGNADDLVYGGRIAHTWSNQGVTAGLNVVTGDRTAGVDADYSVLGLDFHIDKGRLLWKSEWYVTDEEVGGDRTAWYVQPAWRLTPKLTAFYRYDFLDNGGTTGDTIENVIGVNFTPINGVRLRGILTHRDFEAGTGVSSAEALIYQLSATISF